MEKTSTAPSYKMLDTKIRPTLSFKTNLDIAKS